MGPVKRIEPEKMKPVEGKPKRRKVAFAIDTGIEANDCISLHLVNTPEEMQDTKGLEDQSLSFNPEYMQHFVGEHGKIYGYKGLKIDVWLNALSFHAYVDIQYESKFEEGKSEKEATDLTDLMKRIFGRGLVEDRNAFIQSFSSNSQSIENMIHSEGERIVTREILTDKALSAQEDSETLGVRTSSEEIFRLELSNPHIREWHARLEPLVLLFVEGSQPIEQDDPKWEIYIRIQRESLSGGNDVYRLLGFCTVYRFYHYPDTTRLRISQILVFPLYQGKGHGLILLEAVNKTAVSRDCYDVTVEEPSESLQELRDCMDTIRLHSFEPVMPAVKSAVQKLKEANLSDKSVADHVLEGNGNSKTISTSTTRPKHKNWWFPPPGLVEEVRKHLKISKKQFKRCWEILLFLNLDRSDSQCQDKYHISLMEQIMSELFDKSSEKSAKGKRVIDIDNEYDNSKTFVMIRTRTRNPDNGETFLPETLEGGMEVSQEDQLKLVFEERLEEIEQIAEKVSSLCKSLHIPMA